MLKRLGVKVIAVNKVAPAPRSSKDKIPDESKGSKAFVLAAVQDDGSQLNYCQDKVRSCATSSLGIISSKYLIVEDTSNA